MPDMKRIEFLDRQLTSRDDRFLRLETLTVRNHYVDDTQSRDYHCDLVFAPGIDAVAVILFYRDGDRVLVGLTECVRPAVSLRRELPLIHPDSQVYLSLTEVVAGRLEDEDKGEGGIDRRAALEAFEEAGFAVRPDDAMELGGGLFASPGQSPEKIYFRAFEVDPTQQQTAPGDGSPMEAAHAMRFVELSEAITQCVGGEIEDPKAELGFRRLADRLEYGR